MPFFTRSARTSPFRRRAGRLLGLGLCTLLASGLGPVPDTPEDLVLLAPPEGTAPSSCVRIGPEDAGTLRPVRLQRSFLDTFESFAPGSGSWTPHFDHGPYDEWRSRTLVSNEEMQIYVDPGYAGTAAAPLGLDPFVLENGVLKLVADRAPVEARAHLQDFAFVSGMITSRAHFQQLYGYFEIRARFPAGRGLWPAFWLLRPGQWPPEIDVLEVLGADPSTIYMTVHWGDVNEPEKAGCRRSVPDAAEAFHLYGALWTRTDIVFFIDRQPVAMVATKPEMDAPMYMLANLAVGGFWGGPPDEETPFPAAYEIDWIAAYRLAAP